jgi:hypothetical protein
VEGSAAFVERREPNSIASEQVPAEIWRVLMQPFSRLALPFWLSPFDLRLFPAKGGYCTANFTHKVRGAVRGDPKRCCMHYPQQRRIIMLNRIVRRSRRTLCSVVVLMLLALAGSGTALARADTFTDNVKVPVDIGVFIDCANNGAGDFVVLSGNLHILSHTTFDGRGGLHAKLHFQPQGITGFSLTNGAKYNATGVTQYKDNFKVGVQSTYINNFNIIGQGQASDYRVHENVHITINANGQVKASVDNFRITCK